VVIFRFVCLIADTQHTASTDAKELAQIHPDNPRSRDPVHRARDRKVRESAFA